jgi:hypothetical protein
VSAGGIVRCGLLLKKEKREKDDSNLKVFGPPSFGEISHSQNFGPFQLNSRVLENTIYHNYLRPFENPTISIVPALHLLN